MFEGFTPRDIIESIVKSAAMLGIFYVLFSLLMVLLGSPIL